MKKIACVIAFGAALSSPVYAQEMNMGGVTTGVAVAAGTALFILVVAANGDNNNGVSVTTTTSTR